MLEMILVSYGFLVWLVCIKLKLLPWNIKTQVGAVAGGIGIGASILLTINIVTPISHDVRAINFVAEIVPRVSGNVVRVAIEGNQLVKKGDVLLEIDPTPYRLNVKQLEGVVGEDIAQIAQIKAQLELAQYDLESTIIRAPADGYAVNVMVRPGNYLVAMPFRPALSFVPRRIAI